MPKRKAGGPSAAVAMPPCHGRAAAPGIPPPANLLLLAEVVAATQHRDRHAYHVEHHADALHFMAMPVRRSASEAKRREERQALLSDLAIDPSDPSAAGVSHHHLKFVKFTDPNEARRSAASRTMSCTLNSDDGGHPGGEEADDGMPPQPKSTDSVFFLPSEVDAETQLPPPDAQVIRMFHVAAAAMLRVHRQGFVFRPASIAAARERPTPAQQQPSSSSSSSASGFSTEDRQQEEEEDPKCVPGADDDTIGSAQSDSLSSLLISRSQPVSEETLVPLRSADAPKQPSHVTPLRIQVGPDGDGAVADIFRHNLPWLKVRNWFSWNVPKELTYSGTAHRGRSITKWTTPPKPTTEARILAVCVLGCGSRIACVTNCEFVATYRLGSGRELGRMRYGPRQATEASITVLPGGEQVLVSAADASNARYKPGVDPVAQQHYYGLTIPLAGLESDVRHSLFACLTVVDCSAGRKIRRVKDIMKPLPFLPGGSTVLSDGRTAVAWATTASAAANAASSSSWRHGASAVPAVAATVAIGDVITGALGRLLAPEGGPLRTPHVIARLQSGGSHLRLGDREESSGVMVIKADGGIAVTYNLPLAAALLDDKTKLKAGVTGDKATSTIAIPPRTDGFRPVAVQKVTVSTRDEGMIDNASVAAAVWMFCLGRALPPAPVDGENSDTRAARVDYKLVEMAVPMMRPPKGGKASPSNIARERPPPSQKKERSRARKEDEQLVMVSCSPRGAEAASAGSNDEDDTQCVPRIDRSLVFYQERLIVSGTTTLVDGEWFLTRLEDGRMMLAHSSGKFLII